MIFSLRFENGRCMDVRISIRDVHLCMEVIYSLDWLSRKNCQLFEKIDNLQMILGPDKNEDNPSQLTSST